MLTFPFQVRETICGEHNELLTLYCTACKLPACNLCVVNDSRQHHSHDIQSISTMCKAQKVSPLEEEERSEKCGTQIRRVFSSTCVFFMYLLLSHNLMVALFFWQIYCIIFCKALFNVLFTFIPHNTQSPPNVFFSLA